MDRDGQEMLGQRSPVFPYSAEQLQRQTPDSSRIFHGRSVLPTSAMIGLRCGPTKVESSSPIQQHDESLNPSAAIQGRLVPKYSMTIFPPASCIAYQAYLKDLDLAAPLEVLH